VKDLYPIKSNNCHLSIREGPPTKDLYIIKWVTNPKPPTPNCKLGVERGCGVVDKS